MRLHKILGNFKIAGICFVSKGLVAEGFGNVGAVGGQPGNKANQ